MLFDCLVCCSSTFAMIINLLMGADARGTRGQQGRDDSATQSTEAGLHVLFGLFFRAKARILYYPKALFRISTISYSFWVVGFVMNFSISF